MLERVTLWHSRPRVTLYGHGKTQNRDWSALKYKALASFVKPTACPSNARRSHAMETYGL
jgi:hypothetical protein